MTQFSSYEVNGYFLELWLYAITKHLQTLTAIKRSLAAPNSQLDNYCKSYFQAVVNDLRIRLQALYQTSLQ